jgi:hypothetical protein
MIDTSWDITPDTPDEDIVRLAVHEVSRYYAKRGLYPQVICFPIFTFLREGPNVACVDMRTKKVRRETRFQQIVADAT